MRCRGGVSGPYQGATSARIKPATKPRRQRKTLRRTNNVWPLRRKGPDEKILYAPDTNVLMNNPYALFQFEEHDVYIPLQVLLELDKAKKGTTEASQNARETIRLLVDLTNGVSKEGIKEGIPLVPPADIQNGKKHTGKLFFQMIDGINGLDRGHPDQRIIAECLNRMSTLTDTEKNGAGKEDKVIFVSNDGVARILGLLAGIDTEEYLTDEIVEDTSLLHSGVHELNKAFWDGQGDALQSKPQGAKTVYAGIEGAELKDVRPNEMLQIDDGSEGGLSLIVRSKQKVAVVQAETVYNFFHHDVYGINARNRRQNHALNLAMDPSIDLCVFLGKAGSGKTLLALAAGLEQTMEPERRYFKDSDHRYLKVVATRELASLGKESGFLPGTEFDKLGPWMGAFSDNLEVLIRDKGKSHEEKVMTNEVMDRYLEIRSMNFMQGRTFQKRYFIIDECQNLTRLQLRALITRAGSGTKVICLGNLRQIVVPWLSPTSCGLAHLAVAAREWNHAGVVIFDDVERGRLAKWAEETL